MWPILTVLALLQQFSEPDTPVEELLGSSIQIRTKLGKGSHLTVLGQLQLHGTSHLRRRRTGVIYKKIYVYPSLN